jgi:hypothetical protein
MQINDIRKFLLTGQLTVPVAIVCFILLRFFSGINQFEYNHWKIWVIHLFIAIILLQINHVFTIIRERTMLPAVVYLLIIGTNPNLLTNIVAAGIALGFTLCLVCSFSSYQKDSPVNLFDISLILAVCCLFWAPLILFLPLFWYAAYRFQSLSKKSFAASLLGLFIVALFLFAYSVYGGGGIQAMKDYLPFSSYRFFLISFEDWTLVEIIRVFYTGGLVLVSFIYLTNQIYKEKIRNRAILYFLYVAIVVIGITFILFEGSKEELASLITVASSIVIAHYFTLSQNKFTYYTMLFSFIFYITTYFLLIHHDELMIYIPWIDLI